jgi:hypothetical protein
VSAADKDFVRDAARRWGKTLDYANAPGRDAKDGAVAIALWATINVDRLLTIAERRS